MDWQKPSLADNHMSKGMKWTGKNPSLADNHMSKGMKWTGKNPHWLTITCQKA